MRAQVVDWDEGNPLHGTTIDTPGALQEIFARRPKDHSVDDQCVELLGESGQRLQLCIAASEGFAQFTSVDEAYSVAVRENSDQAEGTVKFFPGCHHTEVPRRICLSVNDLMQIAVDFLNTGGRSPSFRWEDV